MDRGAWWVTVWRVAKSQTLFCSLSFADWSVWCCVCSPAVYILNWLFEPEAWSHSMLILWQDYFIGSNEYFLWETQNTWSLFFVMLPIHDDYSLRFIYLLKGTENWNTNSILLSSSVQKVSLISCFSWGT